MNKREMKKFVKGRLATFLLLYGPSITTTGEFVYSTRWRDVPDFFDTLGLYAYRGAGTEAEKLRLYRVIQEIIQEFQEASK